MQRGVCGEDKGNTKAPSFGAFPRDKIWMEINQSGQYIFLDATIFCYFWNLLVIIKCESNLYSNQWLFVVFWRAFRAREKKWAFKWVIRKIFCIKQEFSIPIRVIFVNQAAEPRDLQIWQELVLKIQVLLQKFWECSHLKVNLFSRRP